MIVNDKISLFKENVFNNQEKMPLGFENQKSLADGIKGPDENKASEKLQKSFLETFDKAMSKVNDLQKEADQKIEKFSTGESKNIPEVMIAMEKADIALKLMVKVRNKIVEAYQEVMRMQI